LHCNRIKDFIVASLTIRNIPEEAKLRFRQVAAAHGRSMEEHLRQLVIGADLQNEIPAQGVSDVTQTFKHFEPQTSGANWVRELIRVADGAGEGVFDKGKYAEIRFMTAKAAMAELRRLANGVGLDLPPRMNPKLEAPDF
jgi:plasmid stability protein